MWKENNNSLYKKFELKDFTEALAFIVRVGFSAEKMNHHPTIKNTYNIVEFWLSTHDEDNTVTEKDHKLSARIDAVAPN